MSGKKSTPYFEKEVDLCASFIKAVERHNAEVKKSINPAYDAHKWTPYAETAGWDILLVSQHDGTQVGIEAKLKLNVEVLNQCIDATYDKSAATGPDFRAILVPGDAAQNGVGNLATRLGVAVIRQTPPRFNSWSSKFDAFDPELPLIGPEAWSRLDWTNWLPNDRHKLPEYVPDVMAGDSAPNQLSDWKIQAIKIIAILHERPVTRADFSALRINHQRWFQFWLEKTPDGWVRCAKTPKFDEVHPTIFAQVVADKEKWMPKAKPLAHQLPLQGLVA